MAGKHSKSIFSKSDFLVSSKSQEKAKTTHSISPFFMIIVAITVISLLLTSIFVGGYFLRGKRHKQILMSAAETFDKSNDKDLALRALASSNADITAWLKAGDACVNLAVCSTDDDSFYTNHNQLGKKSRYGAAFLSSKDSFSREGNDKNIVIYGNNMKDGLMFGALENYRNLDFYRQNSTIRLYHGTSQEVYTIFAVLLVGSSKDEDGQEIYNPSKSYFSSAQEFEKWYNQTSERSIINTTIKPQYNENMLSLVTSTDDFDGARLVVIAKETTDNDVACLDLSQATVNANVRHPKKWYLEHGLKFPY